MLRRITANDVVEGVSDMFLSRENSTKLDRLELQYNQLKDDVKDLNEFVKEHMRQEEDDRKQLYKVLFWMGGFLLVLMIQVSTGMPLIPALIGLFA